ncbi:methyltransferase domain-containing protein [Clostridiaceae bacterium M8S5]|nr:methyltransferase domain-containing protein [Clostridiaceae bacterium M8S5]
MKKIEVAKNLIKLNHNIFLCPICGENMIITMNKSLICVNKHTFDLSKYGYINLTLNSKNTKYSKDMFKAKKAIHNIGIFDKMLSKVVDLIKTYYLNNYTGERVNILDLGCGEGSHLASIINRLAEKSNRKILGVGVDIEKEAIKIASKGYQNAIWCVADLAKSPFKKRTFDIITNIFSPSNYKQFNRILKDDGVLIKVVPEKDYLKQLRSVFYNKTDKQNYSNDKVINHFAKNFNIIHKTNINYSLKIGNDDLKNLIHMTPLAWGVDSDKIKYIINKKLDECTIDLCIIIGKKNRHTY